MKRIPFILSFILIAGFATFLLSSCEDISIDDPNVNPNKGILHLSITDAPIDAYDVTGVFITVTDIQIHKGGEDWMTIETFEGPQVYNLLELTDGISELMASIELDAGVYTQLRFMIDAPEEMGQGNHTNPGCYIEFGDGTSAPLFVPSGSQTGYKAIGPFQVPSNGEVHVIADFDVRKSVTQAGRSGRFILKPTIRLIVEDQAGRISGTLTNLGEDYGAAIYAYEAGSYTAEEANEPEADNPRFPNAVTSDVVDEDGVFKLCFLAPGNYDLVVVTTLDGDFHEVAGILTGIEVESHQATPVVIDMNEL